MAKLRFWLSSLLLSLPLVFAHEHPGESASLLSDPLLYLQIAGVALALMLVIILCKKKDFSEKEKKILFWGLSVLVMGSTLFLAGHTIYENVTSITKGPVHWHADYQINVCGERVDLIDPNFPKNKIGSPLFHEHDDDRIHVEGTVDELANVDLGSYFTIIGGELSATHLSYPKDDGSMLEISNGDLCDGQPGTLQVYVNGKRIQDPDKHLMYPDAYVPPGDCIIVEFDADARDTTQSICSSWEVKGWTYDDFEREEREIGGVVWQ